MKKPFDEKFGPYLDGELSAEERERIETAMRTDPQVARNFGAYQRARAAEQTLSSEQHKTPSDFTAKVMARIPEKTPLRFPFSWPQFFFSPRAAWAASALVALIVVAVTLKIPPRQYRSASVYEATIVPGEDLKGEANAPAPPPSVLRQPEPAAEQARTRALDERSNLPKQEAAPLEKKADKAPAKPAGVPRAREKLFEDVLDYDRKEERRDSEERHLARGIAGKQKSELGQKAPMPDAALRDSFAAPRTDTQSMAAGAAVQAENEVEGDVHAPIAVRYRTFPSKTVPDEQVLIVRVETEIDGTVKGGLIPEFEPTNALVRRFGSLEWRPANHPAVFDFEIPKQAPTRVKEIIYFIKPGAFLSRPQFLLSVKEPSGFAAREWPIRQEPSPQGSAEELAIRTSELELHPDAAEVGWEALRKFAEADRDTPPALLKRIRAQFAAEN